MTIKLLRVNKNDIKIGAPLSQSVYRYSGDLLLKKGRIITTLRQKNILAEHGYTKPVDSSVAADRDKSPKHYIRRQGGNDDVFDLKSLWLEDLYQVFNLAKETKITNFSFRLINLASEMQQQIELRHDALIAAFQLDHENHYGLIHALHCAAICEVIAKAAGIPRIERLSIVVGALTHDLGIVEVQEKLHRQKTPLTDEQWTEVHAHPNKSYQKLCLLGVDDSAWLDIARYHHERLDGSGYPEGLKGEQIPIAVRIMTIADIYTAIIRPTVFRGENTGKSALSVLYKERGVTLDAGLVDLFIQELGVYPPGSLVRLKNGEIAIVTRRGDSRIEPLVSALQSADGTIYTVPQLRRTADEGTRIVGDEQLDKNRLLLSHIEKLWSCQS